MLLAARQLGVLERPDRLGQVADRAGVQRTGLPLQVDELDRSARLAAMAHSWASEIKPYGFYCLIQDCAPGNFYSWIWKILT